MSHRDFIRPGGIWTPSMVPTPADVNALDVGAAAAVNGDGGGTYAPTSPIIIGGQPGGVSNALVMSATWSQITGGVTTRRGGRLYLNAYEGGSWPTWNGAQTRTVLCDLMRAAGNFGGNANGLTVSLSPMGLFPSIPYGPGFTFAIPKRYLHQGAALYSLTLNMVVENLGNGTPVSLGVSGPRLGLSIVNADGSLLASSTTSMRAWQPSTAYSANTYVVPSDAASDGVAYRCVASGTSGTTEPSWPGTLGLPPTFDGTAAWEGGEYSGHSPQNNQYYPAPSASAAYTGQGNTPTSLIMGGNPVGSVEFGWVDAASGPLIIDSTQYEYIVSVSQDGMPACGVTFTSLGIAYTGITTLQTE